MKQLHRQLQIIHSGSVTVALGATAGLIVWVLRLSEEERNVGIMLAVGAFVFGGILHALLLRPLLPRQEVIDRDILHAINSLRAFPVRAAQLSWFLWVGLDVVGVLLFYLFFGTWTADDTTLFLSLAIFMAILCGGGIGFLLQFYFYKSRIRPLAREVARQVVAQGHGRYLFSTPLFGLRNKLVTAAGTLIGSSLVFSCLFGYTFIAERTQAGLLSHAENEMRRLAPQVDQALAAGAAASVGPVLARTQLGSGGRLFLLDVEGRDVLNLNTANLPLNTLEGATAVNWRSPWLARKMAVGNGQYSLLAIYPWRMSENAMHEAGNAYLGLFLIAMLTILAVATFTAREIANLLRELVRKSQRMARGDLSQSAEILIEDEIGEFSAELETVRGFLRGVAADLDTASAEIDVVSQRLLVAAQKIEETSVEQSARVHRGLQSVESMTGGLQKIARAGDALNVQSAEGSSAILQLDRTVRYVDDSTDRVMQLLNSVVSGLEHNQRVSELIFANLSDLLRSTEVLTRNIRKFSDSIRRNGERVSGTRNISTRMLESSREGLDMTGQTVNSIALIEDSVERTSHALQDLIDKLNSVGKLIGVIDEVADDTKLLSLNAAIIAAQAGENGLSFAVVAEKIKTLADRTNTATGQIISMIRSVSESSLQLSSGVDEVRASVEETRHASTSSGEHLASIIGLAENGARGMTRVAEASQEQVTLSEGIEQQGLELARLIEQVHGDVRSRLARAKEVETRMQRVKGGALAVKSLARAQAEGGRVLSGDIEQVETMIAHLARILGEQQEQVLAIGRAMKTIEHGSDANKSMTARLRRDVEALRAEAQSFHRFVERFRLA